MFNLNKNLISLKIFLFCFLAAVGCFWPFLTLHMKLLGLNVEDIAIINLILPFVTAFCKPFFAIIADKTGRYKLITSIMLLMIGTFYTSLLTVPPIKTQEGLNKFVFLCSKNGSVIQTPCNYSRNSSNWTEIEISECSECKNSLCLSRVNSENCSELLIKRKMVVSVFFGESQPAKDRCLIEKIKLGAKEKLKCFDLDSECRFECLSEFVDGKKHPVSVSVTFWTYLGLRLIAEVILSSCFPISNGISLSLNTQFGGSFGQHCIFGICGIGLSSFVSGCVIDYVSSLTGSTTYTPCFVMADVMLLLAAVAVYFMPEFQFKSRNEGIFKGLKTLLTNKSLLALFSVCFTLGIMLGYMEIFLNLFLENKGASKLLIGLTSLVSVIPTLPLVYNSSWLMTRVGHVNVFVFSFFVYSLRCVGYVFMGDVWWSVLLESTRVFTVHLPRIALSAYANQLTVQELKVTTQSLVFLIHYDIGRGVGSLLGGTMKDYLGDTMTFQIIAVYSAFLGCAYICLYHFCMVGKPTTTKRRTSRRRSTRSMSWFLIKSRENVLSSVS